MTQPLSDKQLEFICNSTARWNFAHGSVRSGKTVGTLFRFLQAVDACPDSDIAMVGHTSTTIYQNAVRLIMESPQLAVFRPFCTWFKTTPELRFKDKSIAIIGAKDEGAVGLIQGRTLSLVYCDEMTLYPQNVIEMINSRLSKPHSMGLASMNPSNPDHILKKWIDLGEEGDPNFYSLHFTVEDNPYLEQSYIDHLRKSSTGVFYKRNYLGLWCLAEGAIFDFFDKDIHVVDRMGPTEYWIASCDYGSVNPFACLLISIHSGKATQTGARWTVQKEYYWDPAKRGRQKTNAEYADDLQAFLEPYGVKKIYVDPSAASFKLELRRRGMHTVDAVNDVEDGITKMTSEVKRGVVTIHKDCTNLIREIEGYVWDPSASKKGRDEPLKKHDHAIDALRYAVMTHKVSTWDEDAYYNKQEQYLREKYHPGGYGFRGIG
jgi:PBSX family phage terminase large subunit